MEIVIIALALGVTIGYFELIPKKFCHWTNYLTLSGLIILLLTMGIKVGTDPKILANLGNLGLQAFILALFGVVFSIIFIILLEKHFIKGKDKKKAGELG